VSTGKGKAPARSAGLLKQEVGVYSLKEEMGVFKTKIKMFSYRRGRVSCRKCLPNSKGACLTL